MNVSGVAASLLALAGAVGGQEQLLLRGRVVDEAGDAIEGAGLIVTRQPDTRTALEHPATKTDAAGRFRIEWSPPRDWTSISEWDYLLIAALERVSAVVVPAASLLPLAHGTIGDLGDLVLPKATMLRGHVRGDGRPLAGVAVIARDVVQELAYRRGPWPPPLWYGSFATTNDAGVFELPVFPNGAALELACEGYDDEKLPYLHPLDPVVLELRQKALVGEPAAPTREGPAGDTRLEPESAIAGTVVDEGSGERVSSALVLVRPHDDWPLPWWWWLSRAGTSRYCVSDDEGRFRVAGLAAGKYQVRARHALRPVSRSVELQVAAGQERADVRLPVSVGATLTGKIIGTEPTFGWRAELLPTDDERIRMMGSKSVHARCASIASDGSFRFPGLDSGSYAMSLIVPAQHGRGGLLDLPLPPLRVRRADLSRELDVSANLPGVIRGRIRLADALLAPQRLVVVASRHRGATPPGMDIHASVASDGGFSISVLAGEYQVQVLDAATRVPLVFENVQVQSREERILELDVELATVVVRLEPADGGAPAASRLEVRVEHGQRERDDADSGAGVSLADGVKQVKLLLPPVRTRLRVWSNAARRLQPAAVLVEREITPRAGETQRLDIVVPSGGRR